MTMPAHAAPIGSRLPMQSERDAANQMRQILAADAGNGERRLRLLLDRNEKAEVILSPALSDLLVELLRHIGNGDAVTLVPLTQMLTTQQAADILNVSRPYLIGLLEKEVIPHTKVGRHRRVSAEDLFAYKQQRDAGRATALAQLAKADAEFL